MAFILAIVIMIVSGAGAVIGFAATATIAGAFSGGAYGFIAGIALIALMFIVARLTR